VNEQIDLLDDVTRRAPHALRKVRTGAAIVSCQAEGTIGALLGIEGAHALDGNLELLDGFALRGVRYLGLLHFSANEAGYPAMGWGRRHDAGLTRWGMELVQRCEACDVLVDLAHINRRGFFDACALATRPLLVSHTGVLGAYAHWRNIDDAQLRAVADLGGCVGVIFCPRFLGGEGLGPVVRHLQHVIDVVGEDVPALGSDWDGFIRPTWELRDPRGLSSLVKALLEAHLPERVIAKILRDNALRVLDTH
jgi:membrane dipeptidase